MASFAQYCRIEKKAGGVYASRRQIIRAALSKIKKRHRFSRGARIQRHAWLYEILNHHDSALELVRHHRI